MLVLFVSGRGLSPLPTFILNMNKIYIFLNFTEGDEPVDPKKFDSPVNSPFYINSVDDIAKIGETIRHWITKEKDGFFHELLVDLHNMTVTFSYSINSEDEDPISVCWKIHELEQA